MEKIILSTVIGISILVLGLMVALSSDLQRKSELKKESGFAVVELYTSEGCSSCPPADELLSTIVDDARENNERVYALAFHVDYWNYLGWKDIYSKSAYSQRQRKYADYLGSHVYTPQMVVNGRYEFVGSNKFKAQKYINQAVGSRAPTALFIEIQRSGKTVRVRYNTEGLSNGYQLNIALVERGLSRNIKRGENSGKTLHHDNVVRAFNISELKPEEGNEVLSVPKDVEISNASVIAYVQNKKTGQIVAAQKKDVSK